MLKTLAWRNVKRSVGDYRIYFLTLSVSVCLFYLFYSLKDQQKLIELSVIQQNMLDYTFQALQLVSLAVLAILGLLIIYANHFLLQRRKQEFGLYLTMGMGYRKVLIILWLETVLIAGFALGFGLIAGVLGSQVMTFITAELFDAPLKAYQFIISWRTIGSTIVYFSVMFTCVVAFNGLWLTRYQLRDLFTARQRSQMQEPIRISRKIGVLLMGSGLIMTGYTLIFVTKLISNLVVTSIGVSLIVIGTLAIIMMGIPVGLHICQQRKQRYYRGTNSVFIRNMAHQMQTNVLALSVISLLLFATMTTLALGFSYKQAVESNLNEIAPFDGSISLYYSRFESDELPNIRSVLAESKVDINDYGMTETLV
ncbi:MAG: FtsX-like permease family protein, partial [Culicoidibacterales bacterium]